ncbi:unnamed protein product [Lactuca saligna]|uniref:Uncharacterized protein n=1 Tax=Lactuca saligna TaxID=75948 RepID=A0AA35YXD2_LACSI|nr:unnamed protein product [Lactuca saligna]
MMFSTLPKWHREESEKINDYIKKVGTLLETSEININIDALSKTVTQSFLNIIVEQRKSFSPSPEHSAKKELDVDETVFRPWKFIVRMIQDKDIVPYESYDSPSIFEFDWHLLISPNSHNFLIFPPLETSKPRSDPMVRKFLFEASAKVLSHQKDICSREVERFRRS